MAKKRKRRRQLDMAVATIHRRYGPCALVKGKPASVAHVPHISTGFPALDRALGTGGLPKGKICELVGPATSGKTTLPLKFLAQAQAAGGQVAYVDQAFYFDPDYAHRCGLDLSRLLVGTTHDLREALALTEALVHSGGLTALVLMSWTFCGPMRSLPISWRLPLTASLWHCLAPAQSCSSFTNLPPTARQPVMGRCCLPWPTM